MHADDMSGVAVARRGVAIVAERIGGMADRDLGLACSPATRFQIASVSKQFTAAAVLLLASQSLLSLDDPVIRWFGGCPQDWQAITVRHLLTHTSGLGHWDDFPALDQYRPIEPAQELSIFQQQPLLSAPCSRYRYSSPGYALLAWIVEQAADQPYARFLADRVFAPLGMPTASAGDPPGGTGMARGYRGGEPVPSIELATVNCCPPAYEKRCSPRTHRPTPQLHGRAGRSPATATAGRPAPWPATAPTFHTGGNPGYLSVNAWLPDEQITLAVLTNDEATDIFQTVTDLLELAT
jgi:CubicO group peptidase (beta-lactamase class C family)